MGNGTCTNWNDWYGECGRCAGCTSAASAKGAAEANKRLERIEALLEHIASRIDARSDETPKSGSARRAKAGKDARKDQS